MSTNLAYRAFSLLGVEIGLVSNYRAILRDDEYFMGIGTKLHSLLSNFHKLAEIPFSPLHHAYVVLVDSDSLPFSSSMTDRELYISGPIRRLEETAVDKRASIFGNMGLFSKFAIQILERQGVYSFHATAFYKRASGQLFIVLGGTGSGKSTVLLKAIDAGLEVFSTELTHVRRRDGVFEFLKGSVVQNCRVGNLVEDFPSLIERFSVQNVPRENVWQQYLSVDFSSVSTPEDSLRNPSVVILFPRIEADRKRPVVSRMSRQGLDARLFENFCEKISPPSYLYLTEFVPTVDSQEAVIQRQAFSRMLASSEGLQDVWSTLSNPQRCLDGIALSD